MDLTRNEIEPFAMRQFPAASRAKSRPRGCQALPSPDFNFPLQAWYGVGPPPSRPAYRDNQTTVDPRSGKIFMEDIPMTRIDPPNVRCSPYSGHILALPRTGALGHSTKSLRDSPLRGGKSRETVASRWTAIAGGKVTAINKPTVGNVHLKIKRIKMTCGQSPMRRGTSPDCRNDKIGLDE